jgi:hypothetical protein
LPEKLDSNTFYSVILFVNWIKENTVFFLLPHRILAADRRGEVRKPIRIWLGLPTLSLISHLLLHIWKGQTASAQQEITFLLSVISVIYTADNLAP